MKWENLREEEFDQAIARSGGLCVLPIGCLEKHGQHLPVGTDGLIAQHICTLAAEAEEAVVFPTGVWLGDMIGQHALDPVASRTRGAIALNPHTILTILEELCDEIHRNGFRKILIVNSHGGNTSVLDYLTRALRYKPRDYAVLVTTVAQAKDTYAPSVYETVTSRREEFPMITDQDVELLKGYVATAESIGSGSDGHAGFSETSLILGLLPQLCRVDKVEQESGLSTHRADYLSKAGLSFAPGWSINHPNYYGGYAPVGCTETIGQAVVQICVDRMCRIYKLLKEDEDCVRMARGVSQPES